MANLLFQYNDWGNIYLHHAYDKQPKQSDFFIHTHDHYEILGCIQGRGKFIVEGCEYDMKPGSILVTRPMEAHMADVDLSQPYERIMINFRHNVIHGIDPDEQLLTFLHDRPLGEFNVYRNHEFAGMDGLSYLKKMISTAMDRTQQRLDAQIYLYAILNEMNKIFAAKLQKHSDQPRSLAQTIIDHVNDHLHEELSLDTLSEQFFLSKSQISRIFKQATGSSVMDYVVAKRLLQARAYILAGDPPGVAGRRCGFNHYSNFYRAYKRQFGVSPSDSQTDDRITVKTGRDQTKKDAT